MATAASALLALALLPLPADASSSSLMRIARYALNTATYAHPAHIVTAADVLNAFETAALNPPLSTGALNLLANLGELPGAPRDVMVTNPSTYRMTCVFFPASLGASPTVLTCPTMAFALWSNEPFVLYASLNAVAAAARKGRSVSGADVVKAARTGRVHLAIRPTFAAGRGGVVAYIVTLKGKTGTTSGRLCVAMPRRRYGIPRLVSC
jgi:hypothetical protein